MGSKSVTTTTHYCDLCGAETEADDLRHLYGRVTAGYPPRELHEAIDVCPSCVKDAPAADVFAWFDNKAGRDHAALLASVEERSTHG